MTALLIALLFPLAVIFAILLGTPSIALWISSRYERTKWASIRGSYKLISGVEIPDEWAAYSTQQNAEFEIIHRPLWDTKTYTDNSTIVLNFFNTAQANVGLGNEVFPLKNSYLCAAVGVFFKDTAESNAVTTDLTPYTSKFNDHVILANTGVLNVVIGNKEYGPFPMWKLSPGAGIWGLISTAGTATAAAAPNYSQMGIPDPRAMFKLAIPLVIPQNTRVTMALNWAAAVNLTEDSVICLILDGKEARPLQ